MSVQPNMTEQNLPNGLPPSLMKSNIISSPVSFNGVDSSNSSRTSSPANRLQQIPASQLPPARTTIPVSQLPPSNNPHGVNINQLTHNYGQLNIRQQVTPVTSPKVQNFNTSTPILNPVSSDGPQQKNLSDFNQDGEFSPITSSNLVNSHASQGAFTHSAQSCFANVPTNTNVSTQSKSDPNQFQNVPLGLEVTQSNTAPNNNTLTQNKPTGLSNMPRYTSDTQITSHRINNEPNMQIKNHIQQGPPTSAHFQQNLSMGQHKNLQELPATANFPSNPSLGPINPQRPPEKVLFPQNASSREPQTSLQNPPWEGQIHPQKPPPTNAFFHQNSPSTGILTNTQSKMQQSASQPLFDVAKFNDVPLNPIPVQQPPIQPLKQPPTSLQSYNSTPNLHQVPSYPIQSSAQQNLITKPPVQQNMPPITMGIQQKSIPISKPPQNFPYMPQQNVPVPRIPQQNAGSVQNNMQPAEVGLQQIQPSFPPQKVPETNALPQTTAGLSNVPLQPPQVAKANLHSNRYPSMPQYSNNSKMPYQNSGLPNQNVYPNQNQYDYQNKQQQRPTNTYNQNSQLHQNYNQATNLVQGGFNKMWGNENYDLLQYPNILPLTKIEPPKISLGQDFLDAANCSPDIFRCTITKIPESSSLLQKSRLPLGILIHPFRDLDHLPVIQCSTIVRCRACRTYINPFVYFVDMKRWKCNLCYRVNELPEEFQFDPVSKTYGDPSRRPEIKSSTIEYIAPSEYMLRPPQPAVYLFLLDVSHAAVESGYLHTFCNVLTSNLSDLPGDSRTQVGFIAYNSALHFYSLAEGLNQPHEMTVLDIDDVFLPCPDNLIVNLQERTELITDLLAQLPTRFNNSFDTGSALGAALQAAHKMILSTGGRITVFQATLPTIGPGALKVREDPSQRAGVEVLHLNPANDFYKRLALECSGHQIAVDLFVVNSQYVDLATISGISRFSGGCIHHFPLFKASRTLHSESLERCLKRYLTRKIGFEAVMRIRCTRGLSIHTFHGNFFVRSTDLLSLPNVNPEAGFGMQVSIDENLSDLHTVCFQAALLYTSSKGERRIRVHTLCVPVASSLSDIINAADQQCIVGLLAKMAVDRSMQTNLSDAREAFINVAIDILSSYKLSLNLGNGPAGLLAPNCLKLLPLYISALLKHVAFRTGTSTRLDDRVKAMCDMKTLPLYMLIQQIYPDLYPVHNLDEQIKTVNVEGEEIPQPAHLQLSARSLDSKGAFLMDMGERMILLVCPSVSRTFLQEALGVPDYNSITDQMFGLPLLDTPCNQRLNIFINYLNEEKPFAASLQIIRENSPDRNVFIEHLIEDRIETALSYHEFLQHLKTQLK